MESTRASRVRRFTEKPMVQSTMKAAVRETGTVMAGTSMARKLPRNR